MLQVLETFNSLMLALDNFFLLSFAELSQTLT